MEKMFAVIGDPIAHSMSPLMHNDLFQFYQLEAHYLPLQIKAKDLEAAVNGFKAMGVGGLNVTIPHKTAIIGFLDRVDPLAEAIGAVNTVVNENGSLVGYNTDGRGFVKGLLERVASVNGRNILIIGAGGAARAIYFSLAECGAKRIDLCNRTLEKAEKLIEACPFPVHSQAVGFSEAENNLFQYDLIVQTTSIGMSPAVASVPLDLRNLSPGTFVSDIIYNPLETVFLSAAKQRGADIQNGLDMFIFQGALAFEKWTGIFPDTERMRKNVIKQLGGIIC